LTQAADGARQRHQTTNFWGQKVKDQGQDAEDTFGCLAEASFSTPLGRVVDPLGSSVDPLGLSSISSLQ